jgi:hypothetical protein
MTAEDGFSIDRTKAGGRKSHCKICDRQHADAYYAEHRAELYARREAVREAARQAHLRTLERNTGRELRPERSCTRPRFVARRSICARSASLT